MFKAKALLLVLLVLISAPATAADMTAEQSALLYDLLSPYADIKKVPKGVDPKIFERTMAILKEEKLIGAGRPNFKEKDILKKYGKALFLGSRAKEFTKEIGLIHDLVAKGNRDELEKALIDLWVKAGRKKPDSKALIPVLNSLYGAKGAEPQETINHIFKKPNHRVEVVHAKAGGRMQVNVVELNDKGEEEARTVFSGTTETTPTKRGDELQRRIKPEKACTHTKKTDADTFKKIKGEWNRNSGAAWTISGTAENLEMIEGRGENKTALKYEGTYHLGQIKTKHMITAVDDIGDTLPLGVRSQLINKGHSFRIYLESCHEKKKKLRGTWSSQHVTYDSMFMQVSRVHDPYDLSLILSQGQEKSDDNRAEGAADNEIP